MITAMTTRDMTGPNAAPNIVAMGSLSWPETTAPISGTARIKARAAKIDAAPPIQIVIRMALGTWRLGLGVSSATSPHASKP
ncbi:hypothetical protein D3C84_994440 [compost metagenome]